MKKLILVLLALATSPLYAQSCTNGNPCVQLTITNSNPLPSSTVLWQCLGAASSCTQAALNSAIAAQTPSTLCPSVQSVWKCTTFSQTKTPQGYNDPQPWGSLLNYSAQGTIQGGVSAATPIMIFQMPSQAQAPAIGSVPTIVNSGNAGPQ
jgi:hypothetical protein